MLGFITLDLTSINVLLHSLQLIKSIEVVEKILWEVVSQSAHLLHLI